MRSVADFSPFLTSLDQRTWHSSSYDYGGNGQQKTDEISGEGNHNTAEYWEYDNRLGRRWNLDPVVYANISLYSTFNNNPILLPDPKGDEVINEDRRVADKKKAIKDYRQKELSDYKSKHSIVGGTKKKYFLANGGTKDEWKGYKNLQKKTNKAICDFNRWDVRANVTQKIIDDWKINAPNLFNEVDKQSTNFVLSSYKFSVGAFGITTPSYYGDPMNATAPGEIKEAIAEQVNISSVDAETGQYSLNHEAGHFLYIIKYTADYVRFYYNTIKSGSYVKGGHGKIDESGKVAEEFGKLKDIPITVPEIKVKGN